jgi:hypothetical protein
MAQSDEFATLASAAMKEAATAAIGMVDGLAGGALGVVGGEAFAFFETLGERNNEAIAAFRLNALEDEVINLRNELRALVRRLAAEGKKPDRQDPMSQAAIASEFVRNIAEARTVEKRTALVHATVHQFDPRRGSPAMRDYWLQRVRELPEAELSLVLLLAQHEVVAFANAQIFWSNGSGSGSGPLHLFEADVVAYRAIAEQMTNAGYGSLIHKTDATIPIESRAATATAFVLKKDGKMLVSFCSDD